MQMIHMLLPQPAELSAKLRRYAFQADLVHFPFYAHTTWPLDASLFCTLIF